MWQSFDSVFTTWPDAYDIAATGIETAIDTAGSNDGFWESASPAVQQFLSTTASAMPGWLRQVANVVSWVGFSVTDL